VEYVEKNNIAMKHIFLEKWDPSFETMPYPPATGVYAIYTATELMDHINFAIKQVRSLSQFNIKQVRSLSQFNIKQVRSLSQFNIKQVRSLSQFNISRFHQ
jgi:hypothetical protein